MPVNKNATAKQATVTSAKTRKAPGTRLGTLLEWRSDANKSGKLQGRHGHGIRDGR